MCAVNVLIVCILNDCFVGGNWIKLTSARSVYEEFCIPKSLTPAEGRGELFSEILTPFHKLVLLQQSSTSHKA